MWKITPLDLQFLMWRPVGEDTPKQSPQISFRWPMLIITRMEITKTCVLHWRLKHSCPKIVDPHLQLSVSSNDLDLYKNIKDGRMCRWNFRLQRWLKYCYYQQETSFITCFNDEAPKSAITLGVLDFSHWSGFINGCWCLLSTSFGKYSSCRGW